MVMGKVGLMFGRSESRDGEGIVWLKEMKG